jgi:hypothetical protein
MKKTILLLLILLLAVTLSIDMLRNPVTKLVGIKIIKKPKPAVQEEVKKTPVFDRMGEKISYDVRIGNFNIGKAQFHHQAKVSIDERAVDLITFNTRVARFNDMEKIYSDAETFLPVKVERDIRSWPNYEKITEDYDQKSFTLKITKTRGRKNEDLFLKKGNVIHNAVLLPFFVRQIEKLEPGWAMEANLPTQKFEIKLDNIEEISVPAGRFKSYHFISDPARFEIWISADERRIPLKIKGSSGLGYTLVMREYSL